MLTLGSALGAKRRGWISRRRGAVTLPDTEEETGLEG